MHFAVVAVVVVVVVGDMNNLKSGIRQEGLDNCKVEQQDAVFHCEKKRQEITNTFEIEFIDCLKNSAATTIQPI